MQVIADLHIHSRFSRATSQQLNIQNLEKYARIKGLGLLGTGDFMHPKWQAELKQELFDNGSGIYKTKSNFPFVLSNEISLMYSQGGKNRRIHLVLLAPSFEVVDQITDYFKKFGRVDYDGRPIFGRSAIEVTQSLKQISDEIEIIPAHIWTPWFGLLGSKSGFDSFKEAFGNQVKHIYSFETGLSSDPEMNWRVSELDKFTILSFSDAHSFWPWRIGREATIFNIDNLTYNNLIKAIRGQRGHCRTIEVDPSYGKYHFDGHRGCGVSFSPRESKKYNGICPVCGKPITIGVLNRVDELADREEGFKPKNATKFYKLIPLSELISSVYNIGIATAKTWNIYNKLIRQFGSEFDVLLTAPINELEKFIDKKLAKSIIKNREAKIPIKPGYDGVYGKLLLDSAGNSNVKNWDPKTSKNFQKSLMDF